MERSWGDHGEAGGRDPPRHRRRPEAAELVPARRRGEGLVDVRVGGPEASAQHLRQVAHPVPTRLVAQLRAVVQRRDHIGDEAGREPARVQVRYEWRRGVSLPPSTRRSAHDVGSALRAGECSATRLGGCRWARRPAPGCTVHQPSPPATARDACAARARRVRGACATRRVRRTLRSPWACGITYARRNPPGCATSDAEPISG